MTQTTSPGPIAVVLGTRPEIIKLARIVELLGDDAYVVHTGQHFDVNLSATFFNEFAMRPPDTSISVGGQTRGQQIGTATSQLDSLFAEIAPTAVVVQGDTNAVAAGALAANSNGVPLIHVEAGLRSFDRAMPEEHNRVVADHLSDLCLAPTALNVSNLAAEGITGDRVVKTGNPVIEAVTRLLPEADERTEISREYGVEPDGFVLATIHRPENVDNRDSLVQILTALGRLDTAVVLPLHPRTRARIEQFSLEGLTTDLHVVDPIRYRHFIALAASSRLIVSDSGGVQEEVAVLKRPSVVIRRSTERPEVEGTFVRRLRPSPELPAELCRLFASVDEWAESLRRLGNPYGDSSAPRRSIDAIRALVASG